MTYHVEKIMASSKLLPASQVRYRKCGPDESAGVADAAATLVQGAAAPRTTHHTEEGLPSERRRETVEARW